MSIPGGDNHRCKGPKARGHRGTGRAGEDSIRQQASKGESEEVSGGQDLSSWAKESGLNSQSLAGG